MRNSVHWMIVLLTALTVLPASLLAQPIEIPVTGPETFRKYPLAVPELKNFGETQDRDGLAQVGQKVLMTDLAISGVFDILDPKSFLEDPVKSGLTESTINFTQWIQVGAEGLVKGGFWLTDNTVKLDLRLFDVALGKQVLNETYEGPTKQFRRFLHMFSNRVLEHFTKIGGVFNTRIAAVQKVKDGKNIVVMDFDGYNAYTVVDNGNLNLLPAWNASGSGLFFTSYIGGNPDLFYADATPNAPVKVISSYRGLNVGADLSADGKSLVLTLSKDGNSEIYTMTPDGKNAQRVTASWGIDSSPSFSPDGKRLAFVSNRSGSPQIYTMDINGQNITRLTFQGNYNTSPAWSPKGDLIVFTGRDERSIFDAFTVSVETREIKRLTQDQGNNEDPAWSPDGRHIVISSDRGGQGYQLWIMNADGTNQRQITFGPGQFTSPSWSPRISWGIEK